MSNSEEDFNEWDDIFTDDDPDQTDQSSKTVTNQTKSSKSIPTSEKKAKKPPKKVPQSKKTSEIEPTPLLDAYNEQINAIVNTILDDRFRESSVKEQKIIKKTINMLKKEIERFKQDLEEEKEALPEEVYNGLWIMSRSFRSQYRNKGDSMLGQLAIVMNHFHIDLTKNPFDKLKRKEVEK